MVVQLSLSGFIMQVLRISLTVLGVLLTLIGVIWIGQGSGYFPYPASSFMINQSPWMLRGALLAIAGLAMIFVARHFIR
jgi:hypothetical protein